jgi:hypothetical protein
MRRSVLAEPVVVVPSLVLTAAALAFHLVASARYGFARDELYFIACGAHPDWGYVDQPSLVPLLSALAVHLSGSLQVLRLVPTLAAGAAVAAACAIVRRLGGGWFAETVAGLAVFLAPVYLGMTSTFNTSALEPPAWTLTAYFALRAVLDEEPRWWYAVGLTVGVAVNNKYGIVFFALALVAALLLCNRKVFRAPAFWGGIGIALALGLPNLSWQAAHGWPFLELLRDDAREKTVVMPPLQFLAAQFFMVDPLTAPVLLGGIGSLLFARPFARLRFLGVAFLLLLGTFLVLPTRDYYLSPVYAMQLAVGAVWLERVMPRLLARAAVIGLLLASGLAIAPFASPIVPPATFIAYEERIAGSLHLRAPLEQRNAVASLPQHYAEEFGWPQLARTVGRIYREVPPDLQARTAVITQDYGEAGALDFFGPAYGLPRALSGQNNYFLWGTRGYDGTAAIVVGYDRAWLSRYWRDVRLAGRYEAEYIMPFERHRPIWLVREPRAPLATFWGAFRHID